MTKKLKYFASSNSREGFKSYFDNIYCPERLERIYIIKGGPGTGKSSIIKTVGKIFESTENCEYFICSSDPNSLDGLIINGKIALIDGTSPHVVEAKYAGVVEKVIDTARGISNGIKYDEKEIKGITQKKRKCFLGAYSCLKAYGEINEEQFNCIAEYIDYAKIDSAVKRFFKQNVTPSKKYNEKIRLLSGVTPMGYYNTHTFEDQSETCALIINARGEEDVILKEIRTKAKEYALSTLVSYDPIMPNKINGIFLPESSLCVVPYDKKYHGEIDYDKYKIINFERFVKITDEKAKSKLKFLEKCSASLLDEATERLKEAYEEHCALESLYKKYMDYSLNESYIEEIVTEIKDFLRP